MNATITAYHESEPCLWCSKTNEGVTIEFRDGFLDRGPLCFKCLQQAVRVHHRQNSAPAPAAARGEKS